MKFTLKKIQTIVILGATGLVLMFVLLLSSCGGDGGTDPTPEPEPTAGEKVLINLVASAWKMKSVAVDGVDKSSLFTGLTISFTSSASSNGKPTAFSGSFTTTNGGPVWPASGNWTITDQTTGASLSRDGLAIQLTEVTESSLKMSLNWNKDTFGPGRVESIKGQHVFTMGK